MADAPPDQARPLFSVVAAIRCMDVGSARARLRVCEGIGSEWAVHP
ncbi:MAG TPA: hypothetical protein VNO81_14240 [Candidatus Nitrosotenuis sp.]|nr:hypothetical protein [Candidatus Nitrosotenuis sp.]